jgi:hypothetical protein
MSRRFAFGGRDSGFLMAANRRPFAWPVHAGPFACFPNTETGVFPMVN